MCIWEDDKIVNLNLRVWYRCIIIFFKNFGNDWYDCYFICCFLIFFDVCSVVNGCNWSGCWLDWRCYLDKEMWVEVVGIG